MARTQDRKRGAKGKGEAQPPEKLPWRITKIRLWREAADMTQQEVADRLVQMDPNLGRDRVSVGRIEKGKQKPDIEVLDAMVVMFNAPNLSAMLDKTPEEAEALRKIEALDPKEIHRVLRMLEAAKDEGP